VTTLLEHDPSDAVERMTRMINVSDTVSEFIGILDTYAQDGLHERDNLARLLQHAKNSQNTEMVGDIAFLGKYLWKLYGTMRKETPDGEHYEQLEQEFSRTVHEFHAKLGLLITGASEDFREMMEKHYLEASERSLKNLIALSHDFNWLKNWELEMAQRDNEGAL
jgi:hypothetical protein